MPGKLGLAAVVLAAWAPREEIDGAPEQAAKPPRVVTTMRCVVDGAPDRLEVDVVVTGLDPSKRDLAFELPLWGEWIELDEYYVTRVRGDPPVEHDLVNRFYWRPQLPESWNGRLELHYEIPVVALKSAAHDQHGLLPWRTASYVHAFSINTLMRLLVGDQRQDADRTLELVPPKGTPKPWRVATGWGGLAEAGQSLTLAAGADNTAIFFGEVVATSRSDGAGGEVEVVQFGRHADRTKVVLALAQELRAACAKSLGVLPPGREMVLITEPGLGGTRIDGAIVIGYPDVEKGDTLEVGTAHFLAHEMFHDWLPGVLAAAPELDERGLEWFFEGFTEYFSLWHLASIGRVTPAEFADRARFFEQLCQQSPAWGKVAFGDDRVNWREPGAERIAYRGGMLLAFHLDAELRAHGEPGLLQLFRDLVRENGARYDLAAIRGWCEANGLEESWKKLMVAPPGFTTDAALEIAGEEEFFRFVPADG